MSTQKLFDDLLQKSREYIRIEVSVLQERQAEEHKRLVDKKQLALKFQLSPERCMALINHNRLCCLCEENARLEKYQKGHVINGNIYCDGHGDLMLNHRPSHPETVANCYSCAALECPFLSEDHDINDPEKCPECREAFF